MKPEKQKIYHFTIFSRLLSHGGGRETWLDIFLPELKDYLQSKDIQTGIHYPIALPKLQAYHYLAQQDEDFFANQYDLELLSLPIGEHMDMDALEYIVEYVQGWPNGF